VKDKSAHLEPVAVLPAWCPSNVGLPGDRSIMTSTEASHVATQLDEHHAPETNGRMAVCRRCGARTEDVAGLHHLPSESQLARSTQWLAAQSRLVDIERARRSRPQ
jgi:hypothetical protein